MHGIANPNLDKEFLEHIRPLPPGLGTMGALGLKSTIYFAQRTTSPGPVAVTPAADSIRQRRLWTQYDEEQPKYANLRLLTAACRPPR